MRLDEITIDGAPAHIHKIIKDTFLSAIRDVQVGEAFMPFHKHVKVKAQPDQQNLVTVRFKTPSPHAPRSIRFAGGGKTQDELDFEHLQQAAKDVAEEMLFILQQELVIEDSEIQKHNNSVTLFMVSDGFIDANESVEEAKAKKKLKVNYDSWSTKPPKNMNEYHVAVLRLMDDGKARERSVMIRQATDLDPNPVSRNGFAGWNKIDYDLYKMGYLKVVDILPGGKKVFKITPAGKRAWPKSEWADPKWDY